MKLGIIFLFFLLFSCSTTAYFVKEENKLPKNDFLFLPEDSQSKLLENKKIDFDLKEVFIMPRKISDDFDCFPKTDNEKKLKSNRTLMGIDDDAVCIKLSSDVSKISSKDSFALSQKNLNNLNNQVRNNDAFEKEEFDKKEQIELQEKINTFEYLSENEKTQKKAFANIEADDIGETVEDKNFDISNSNNGNMKNIKTTDIDAKVNDEVTIVLAGSDWIIKRIYPDAIKLEKREVQNETVIFRFKTELPGSVTVTFIRNGEDCITEFQDYNIKIKSPAILENDKKTTVKKNKKNEKKDNKQKDDPEKKMYDEFFNQKRYYDAKTGFLSLIERGKGDSEIYYKMGIIENEEGKSESSISYFDKNIKEKDNPYYGRSLVETMRILKKNKKFAEAVNLFTQFGTSDEISPSESETLYMLLSDIFFNMGDFKSASSEYAKFIEIFPDSQDIDKAIFYLAYAMESYTINPDYKEAFRLYKLLVENYPESKYKSPSKKRILRLERHYLKIN
ncbi:MAG TPA: outer membrane protein assembly factor BamD [Spirochaetota bacterium]|nr:outer membrane protein assembly factor BamD [Spirochaetota bacterium]